MENKLYIGIDVGSEGFISAQYNGQWQHYAIEDYDLYQLSEIFWRFRDAYVNIACVIEDVHALGKSAAKSTFSFGFNKGYLVGLLAANKIPYSLVSPSVWQKEMWDNSDMVVSFKDVVRKDKVIRQKVVNTKQTSMNACKRLFPMIDQRKSERAKKPNDNKVDSILMAEYARRKNL